MIDVEKILGELIIICRCAIYLFFFFLPDPFSPFGSSSGWRNNIHFNRNITLQLGDKSK